MGAYSGEPGCVCMLTTDISGSCWVHCGSPASDSGNVCIFYPRIPCLMSVSMVRVAMTKFPQLQPLGSS